MSLFNIGPYQIDRRTILAPMAGVTDLPFRQLCREMGAGLVVSEMVAADPSTWDTRKSRLRIQFGDEPSPKSVQIAGYDPEMMAVAARFNVEQGAEIIDINMGCPAKKVCKRAAGSALLQDPQLVEDILRAVIAAVDVPVTLKIRTGWDRQNRNGISIAKIAEQTGIAALAVHGRTRACRFVGEVEYDTIAGIVEALSIPVIANGDITSPEKAAAVLSKTGAAAVMIGRGAQGNPWIFNQINHFLETGEKLSAPSFEDVGRMMARHLKALHDFYGEVGGVRISRKHIGWYSSELPGGKEFTQQFNKLDSRIQQQEFLQQFFLNTTNQVQAA
ncbi:MAG: tRNA dihydrouridine synthase DusB [Porticoccaceae bacterium]|nr:tRNA dihydrouridine synthase DusB [Porticoccaceae bacterium]MBT5577972.1 tRNA dihydrouridine synthase DusB [Porticoccaceae bacterium]MBT7376208.1 tRNA dihydrouridine synthase DusB [Porticoccaceae bacterium]